MGYGKNNKIKVYLTFMVIKQQWNVLLCSYYYEINIKKIKFKSLSFSLQNIKMYQIVFTYVKKITYVCIIYPFSVLGLRMGRL